MSRGPGRWQRLLLEALYEHPSVAPSGVRYVHPQDWLQRYLGREPTPAEVSAVYRAARSLARHGLARPVGCAGGGRLEPMPGYEHDPPR